jgi:uncharacterized membrane protein YvbJ
MKEVTCTRCGQTMPDSYSCCPICGTTIEKQPQATLNTAQQRYVVWFVILTIACIAIALWLPR